MSGAPIESLQELLRALGRERSLRGRMRVLARAWTLLRSLSPPQREQVALRVGSRWAWKRLEKAFLRDGELSESEQLVGRAFEQMSDADPQELRRIVRTIKEGDTASARDLLMMTLTEALEEEADERAESIPAGGPRAAPAASSVSDEDPERAREPEARVVETTEEVLASALARNAAAPKEREAAEVPTPQPRPPAPREPEPARPAPRTAPVEAPRALPGTAPEPAARPEPPALASAPEPEPAPLSIATGSGTRLQVLRALQRSPRSGADLGRAGRAELVASLGGGWASRRAVSRLIAAGSLEDLDEALQLIRQLERAGDRNWCLADLLACERLDPAEVERVLAAAPSDAARRRLFRRVRAT